MRAVSKTFNKPIYYVYGTEQRLIDAFLGELKAALLAPGFESMNYHSANAEGLDTSSLLTEARTMPAFSEKRLIVVRKASSLKPAHKKDLMPYLLDPSPWTVLVFVSTSPKPSKDKAFMGAVRKNGEVRVFRPPGQGEALAWIRREASARGKTMDDEAALAIVKLAGGSLTAAGAELEKIILFVGGKERIEASDVAEVGLDVKVETVFDLSDAIGAKDLGRAFKVYSKVSKEPPLMLIGAIARHMRVLLKIKAALGEGIPGARLASIAGVPPSFLNKYTRSCRLFSMEDLKRSLRSLFEINLALKTSAMPEDVAMTYLIIRLCQ